MFHWSKRITPRNLIYGNLLQTLLCEIKSTQKCIYSGIISPAWHISCWNKALRYNFLQNHFQKGIFPHSRIFVISYCNKKEQKLILWTFGFIKDNVQVLYNEVSFQIVFISPNKVMLTSQMYYICRVYCFHLSDSYAVALHNMGILISFSLVSDLFHTPSSSIP